MIKHTLRVTEFTSLSICFKFLRTLHDNISLEDMYDYEL